MAKVVFDADTGRYVSSVDNVTKSTMKAGEAVAAAKNKILESYRMQMNAAKDVGASAQELEAIQRRSAQMMASVTETNTSRIINSLDRIAAKNKAVAAELGNLSSIAAATGAAEGGLSSVPNRLKTSTVLRVTEGSTSIRGAEAFISAVPALAAFSNFVFPVAAAAGFISIVGEGVSKVIELAEKWRTAGAEAQRAFDAMHAKDQVQVDDLEITNQKIQDQIDKLSGHPNNGLATAILEAKKMADQLLPSLQADRKEMEALFKEHSVGTFQSLFTGVASTAAQEKNLLGDQDKLQEKVGGIDDQFDIDSSGVKDQKKLKDLTDRRNAAVREAFNSQIDNYERELGRLRKEQTDSEQAITYDAKSGVGTAGVNAIDNSAKIQELQNVIRHLQARSHMEMLNEDIFAGNEKLGTLKQNKGLGAGKDHELEDIRNQFLQLGAMAPEVAIAFWKKFADSSNEQVANYAMEQGKHYAEELAKGLKTSSAIKDFWKQQQEGAKEAAQALEEWNKAKARAAEEATKATERAGLSAAMSSARYDEARIGLGRRTGQLSAHDAATQLANVHAQQYDAQMKVLMAELNRQGQMDPNSAASIEAAAAVAKANADRQVQIMEDAANTAATNWTTALNNAYDLWYQHAKDTAGQVADLFKQGIDGANQNIVDMMSGDYKRGDWKKYGHNMFKSAAGDMLEQSEARFLGPLGLGKKRDGNSTDSALYVIDASQGGGQNGGGLMSHIAGLGKLFHSSDGSGGSGDGGDGSGDGSGDSGGGSGIGGFFKTLFGAIANSFQGGKALGGGIDQSGFYDVGEMGRERVFLPRGSYVQPHNQMGGGGTTYSINVANGVTPEQMDMKIRAALQEFHPHVVRASVQAVHDHQARQPRR